MAKPPTYHATPIDDGVLVAVSGEVDFNNASELHVELDRHLAGAPKRMIVDLAGVRYMDSSGLATMVQALQAQKAQNGKLVLCNLPDRVHGVFRIARLDSIFTIVPDVEAAKTV